MTCPPRLLPPNRPHTTLRNIPHSLTNHTHRQSSRKPTQQRLKTRQQLLSCDQHQLPKTHIPSIINTILQQQLPPRTQRLQLLRRTKTTPQTSRHNHQNTPPAHNPHPHAALSSNTPRKRSAIRTPPIRPRTPLISTHMAAHAAPLRLRPLPCASPTHARIAPTRPHAEATRTANTSNSRHPRPYRHGRLPPRKKLKQKLSKDCQA